MVENPTETPERTITGATLVAKALAALDTDTVFGVVGVPVVEIAEECRRAGIQFVACRSEQTAAFAAGAHGYLAGTPGVCLVVSGPGLVNALSGMANAAANGWPLVVLAGATDRTVEHRGGFQELDQIRVAQPFCKHAERPAKPALIPETLERAVRVATCGRPGVAYVDLPADVITGRLPAALANRERLSAGRSRRPTSLANPVDVAEAADVLCAADAPLVIIGKGAAMARAETAIQRLLKATRLPFLPTPMGKGVVSDEDPQCVAGARALALASADTVLVLGARLNWMLHFGLPPRWRAGVRIIQVDVCAEELGRGPPPQQHTSLLGTLPQVVDQLADALAARGFVFSSSKLGHAHQRTWRAWSERAAANAALLAEKTASPFPSPLSYHAVFGITRDELDPASTCVLVSEGANTMDIARTVFAQTAPRTRLDAGTCGTMGIGLGFALAAHIAHPLRRVLLVVGDSAFGFSAMDLETAARYRIPLLVLVVNNNGIYSGISETQYRQQVGNGSAIPDLPSTALMPDCRYDLLGPAVGGRGWQVRDAAALRSALREAWAIGARDRVVCVINVMIGPGLDSRLPSFSWQSDAHL